MAKNQKTKKKKHRVFWGFIKVQIVLMTLVMIAVGYYFVGGYAKQVDALRHKAHELVVNSDPSAFVPSQTVTVYAANGDVISEKKSAKQTGYVTYEDIPADFVTAIISIEDKKFYSHNGVDIKGLLRAVKAMLKNGEVTQGGSTITMQLAKLIYMDVSRRDWQYKIEQMAIAMELEKIYSKNKIMEFYLNNIYFANGYYGIVAACKGYFNCELSDLTVSQVAFLLAIPNSPTYYDPLTNYDNTIKRRNLILRNMREDGKISERDYENAVNEIIILDHPEDEVEKWNNYVDTYTYYCATRALMEANGFEFKQDFETEEEEKEYDEAYDEQFARYQKQLFSKGYSIYTSIDMDKQNALQETIDKRLKQFKGKNDEGIYEMQSSAVTIDNDTGMVVAIVGGRSQDFSSYTLNRAYQSHRQPGSSIKPLIVYTPCFENGYTKDSKIVDEKFKDGPKNAANIYYGDVTIDFAVQQSLNTVAWKLYEELTPEVGLSYLRKMNFNGIVDEDYILPTCLGGFTKGVSSLEMASAYSALENDGVYREPSCVRSIVDKDQNVVYKYEPLEQIVYTETAARMMTEVLTHVFKGTARDFELDNHMPAAVKTGTTNDSKDSWFVGYTRYYTTAVWVGFDMPKTIENLTKEKYSSHIWQDYMNHIHEGLSPLKFLPYAKLSDDFNREQSRDDQSENRDDEDEQEQQENNENQDDRDHADDADHDAE